MNFILCIYQILSQTLVARLHYFDDLDFIRPICDYVVISIFSIPSYCFYILNNVKEAQNYAHYT